MALHYSPIGQTFVLDDTEVAMVFAVFLARESVKTLQPIIHIHNRLKKGGCCTTVVFTS